MAGKFKGLDIAIGKTKILIKEEERIAEETKKFYSSGPTKRLNHGGMIRLNYHNHAISKMKEILSVLEEEFK